MASLHDLQSHVGKSPEPTPATVAAVFILFIAAWSAYGLLSTQGMALHDDLTEAYVWGKEFQLGYNQHPPLWAWIAGLWFLVFPNREWAFVLLAVLNSATGLLGAWFLLGRFATGLTRQAAWLLLLCTPFYTFHCYMYNANTIFLSIWPWTLFCFVRALESRRLSDSIWFGAMIGAALLSKYYAITLVLTCLTASAMHAEARAYWRSASPWISVVTASALLLPHIVWLVANQAPPLQYALELTGFSLPQTVAHSLLVLVEVVCLQLAIPALIWLTATRISPATQPHRDIPFLVVLVATPMLLTAAFAIGFGLRIGAKMMVGIFPLVPLLALQLMPRVDPRRLVWWTSRGIAIATILVVAASPLIARIVQRPNDVNWAWPQREAANAAIGLWKEVTGSRLAFVGGSKFFGSMAAVLSDDRPSGFVFLEFRRAPWVTPEALRHGGLLALCIHYDGDCRGKAIAFGGPAIIHKNLTLTHTAFGKPRATMEFDIYIIPPAP